MSKDRAPGASDPPLHPLLSSDAVDTDHLAGDVAHLLRGNKEEESNERA